MSLILNKHKYFYNIIIKEYVIIGIYFLNIVNNFYNYDKKVEIVA